MKSTIRIANAALAGFYILIFSLQASAIEETGRTSVPTTSAPASATPPATTPPASNPGTPTAPPNSPPTTPPSPAPAPSPVVIVPPAPPVAAPSNDCIAVLTFLRTNTSSSEIRQIYKETEVLRASRNEYVRDQGRLSRQTKIRNLQLEDQVLFLLARGEYEEVLELIKPVFDAISESYNQLVELGLGLKNAKIDASAAYLASNEYRAHNILFQDLSIKFGAQYDTYNTVISALRSVANGRGILDGATATATSEGEINKLVFDLTQRRAIEAANLVLRYVDPDSLSTWFANDANIKPWQTAPSYESVREMFRGNMYALIGKLRKEVTEERKMARWYIRIMEGLANFYTVKTNWAWLPENYRQIILKFVGIVYDEYMISRYLDKVQAVVQVSRRVDKGGRLVMVTTDDVLNLQVKTLLEYFSQAPDGDDFLTTFARISYHTDVWTQIADQVAKLAANYKKDDATGNQYANLLARMRAAEKDSQTLLPLPYVYDPATVQHMRLAIYQLFWSGLITEETTIGFLRQHAWTILQNIFPLLH